MVLRLRREAPSWRGAKCLGSAYRDGDTYEDPWFGGDNEDDEAEQEAEMEEARAVCNGDIDGRVCPIREQCLIFALTNNERYGVWGGTSEEDRRAIRKKYPWKHSLGDEPHPEWRWHAPGEVAATLTPKERAAIQSRGND